MPAKRGMLRGYVCCVFRKQENWKDDDLLTMMNELLFKEEKGDKRKS